MPRLGLHFLGMPRVLLDDSPVDVDRRKGVALLAYLAVTARAHGRDALATLFWPEHDQVTARANLRRTLSLLHTALHEGWLAIDRENVALPPAEGLWVDVLAFRRCLSECRTSGHPDPAICPQCIERLESAAAFYTDDFLAGFTLPDAPEFDDWQFRQAEALRTEFSDALARLAHCQMQYGNFAAAIAHARRRVALDPLHEPGQRQLMEELARSGDKAGAARQYQTVTDLLRRELAAAPARETTELARTISEDRLPPLGGQASHAAAALAVNANSAALNEHPASQEQKRKRHNLPAEVTGFIGREDELAELARLLAAPACRLVTIVGPGGIGKTRLALQSAAGQLGRFADGIFFVALAPLGAAEFMVSAIAEAVGCPLQAAQDPRSTLLHYLSGQQLLLVLDNCEHLLAGIELISALLQAAPELQVLATSRERLNLQGEWVFDLGGLPFPAVGEPAEGAERYSAVQLFVERAQQQRRDFAPGAELPCIVEICRLVEGMPLGLELAAAWTRNLTCAEIAEELGDRLDLLATSQRDVPERHRSLRAVFDHSWRLLSEDERTAFPRLAVFRGGFTREAAQAVAGARAALLASLLDKSLLRREADGRYGLHELVRQYAFGKLQEAGEEGATHERHAGYFLALAERADPELRGSEQMAWLARLDAEHDNLRAALSWSLAARQVEIALRLAGALGWFWFLRGHLLEGHRWLEQVLITAEAAPPFDMLRTPPSAALARALNNDGNLSNVLGNLAAAESRFTAACAMGREVGAWQEVANGLGLQGVVQLYERSDYAGARASLEESQAICHRLDNLWGIAMTLCLLGEVSYMEDDYERAQTHLEKGLALFRKLGEQWGMGACLKNLALVARARGQFAQALTLFSESLAIFEAFGFRLQVMESAEGMASAYAALGQLERAVRVLAASEAQRTLLGFALWPASRPAHQQALVDLAATLGQAQFDALWAEGRAMSLEDALAAAPGE